MNLQDIATKLNILSYPEALNNIKPCEDYVKFTDPKWLSHIESEFHILGEYYSLVCKAAAEVQEDKLLLCWGNVVSQYLCSCTVAEARLIPMPERDGTLARDFLPLLILLSQVSTGVAEYRHRGMPEDMIHRNLFHFVDGISIVKHRTGRPAIDQTYFNWLMKFVKAKIFNAHGFNFELRELPDNVCVLQNIHTGNIYPVLLETNIHRSGQVLLSAGYSDAEGSFQSI